MLALLFFSASLIEPTSAARTATQSEIVREAVQDVLNGRYLTAQAKLIRQIGKETEPIARLPFLDTLIEICIYAGDAECLAAHVDQYANDAIAVTKGADYTVRSNTVQSLYYAKAYAIFLAGPIAPYAGQIIGTMIDTPDENPFNVPLYFKRQLLCAQLHLELRNFQRAQLCLDKALSLIATLENPEASRYVVATTLAEAIGLLADLGEFERAFGIYRSVRRLPDLIPSTNLDGVRYRMVEATLLERVGDPAGAKSALDGALELLPRIEIAPATRSGLTGQIQATRAVLCVYVNDSACATSSIREHPFHDSFERKPRSPQTAGELSYLAARAFVHASGGKKRQNSVANAVAAPLSFGVAGVTEEEIEAYRLGALALAGEDKAAGSRLLIEAAGKLMAAVRLQPSATFGTWYRPGVIDQTFLRLALLQAGAEAAAAEETLFLSMQLMGRSAASFQMDALAALSSAKSIAERRQIHSALRLRARRDRKERALLQAVVARAASRQPLMGQLTYDARARAGLREMNERMAATERQLASGFDSAGLVDLRSFQRVLRDHEVALAVAPTFGPQLAYMCVRKGSARFFLREVQGPQMSQDARLVRAALTATHAPSDQLDAQYPVEAAVRLHDQLLKPFGDCVKEGDAIAWMPGIYQLELPLTALLPRPPPKAGAAGQKAGWDLRKADWVVRRHGVSYPGSAALLVATRRPRTARAAPAFDFLGVGDPSLPAAPGASPLPPDRAGLTMLKPLPETRQELSLSSSGFANARLLVGGEASEAVLRRQLLGSYRYLSFATHGLIRDDIDGLKEPALVLTPRQAISLDDGIMTANEIADLNFNADFVALSACNTANYDLEEFAGELPALAAAFAIAGVPATLATLWPVDSPTSQAVVASVFGSLRTEDEGPAEALAAAQRHFLATNSVAAKFHPRFWAPFVLLGDGAAVERPRIGAVRGVSLATVEAQVGEGEEVLAVQKADGTLYARVMTSKPRGKYPSAVRASRKQETWRHKDANIAAAALITAQGSTILAGGHVMDASNRMTAVLERIDRNSGGKLGEWRGDGLIASGSHFGRMFTLPSGRRMLPLIGMAPYFDAKQAPAKVVFLDVADAAKPRPMLSFEVERPIDPLTFSVIATASGHLIAHSNRWQPQGETRGRLDDYDITSCTSRPVTWLEIRDLGGRLLKSRQVEGFAAATALRTAAGDILLAGTGRSDCFAEEHARIERLGTDLELTPWYEDKAAGASRVRALAQMADRRIILLVNRDKLVDVNLSPSAILSFPESTLGMDNYVTGEVALLSEQGDAIDTLYLDAGSDLFISALDASDPNDIVIGGGVGDEAALFHVTLGR